MKESTRKKIEIWGTVTVVLTLLTSLGLFVFDHTLEAIFMLLLAKLNME